MAGVDGAAPLPALFHVFEPVPEVPLAEALMDMAGQDPQASVALLTQVAQTAIAMTKTVNVPGWPQTDPKVCLLAVARLLPIPNVRHANYPWSAQM